MKQDVNRLNHTIRIMAQTRPDTVAIQQDSRCISYAQLYKNINQIAHYMLEEGLEKGDRVGIVSENNPDILILTLAALRIGVVLCLFNSRLGPNDLTYVVNQSDARWLFVGESARQAVVVSLPNLSPSLKLLSISGLEEGAWQIFSTSCYQRCTDKDPKHKAVSNDDIVHFNTSGTTDLPKAVVHNWRSLNASFKINRDTRKDRNIDTSHSVILVASPLCATSGFRQAMEVLSKGYTLILHKAFEPEKIYRDI